MRLATASANFSAGLGAVRAATGVGQKADEDLMDQTGVKRNIEHLGLELEITDHFTGHVVKR
jgi:hypothetical protein